MTIPTIRGMIHIGDYETNPNNDDALDAAALPRGGMPA